MIHIKLSFWRGFLQLEFVSQFLNIRYGHHQQSFFFFLGVISEDRWVLKNLL